jgi:hypothetical protein
MHYRCSCENCTTYVNTVNTKVDATWEATVL